MTPLGWLQVLRLEDDPSYLLLLPSVEEVERRGEGRKSGLPQGLGAKRAGTRVGCVWAELAQLVEMSST